MLIGAIGMGVALAALGLAAYWQWFQWWSLVFILGYIACFAMSVGPVTWVILSEIFPTQIRGRAMGLATICLWLANYVVSQTFPMMDANPWLLARFITASPSGSMPRFAPCCSSSFGAGCPRPRANRWKRSSAAGCGGNEWTATPPPPS